MICTAQSWWQCAMSAHKQIMSTTTHPRIVSTLAALVMMLVVAELSAAEKFDTDFEL
jgi:hypothetical protein